MDTSVTDNKFLTFSLGAKEYGIDITKVREIIGYTEVTPIPRAVSYVHGVIDLRGKIVPIVSLRGVLGMEPAENTHETCVVIVELGQGTARELPVGFVVDGMQEVRQIEADGIESAPDIGNAGQCEVIRGFAKLATGIVILLEVDLVLSDEATSELAHATVEAALSHVGD